ncbi:MbtH family NRPS accessory protein [Burkholderia sp. 567]|uniref:MbtH family protein n=1 Tax=Burkholderia sp. 567 TaxID=3156413 RepID=UPI0033942A65
MEVDTPKNAAAFNVVVNHEEQYAICPDDKPVPEGWQAPGASGARDVCLEWFGANWTDRRPLSVRAALSA